MYHLCEATIAEPAILHDPTQAPQVSASDRLQTEAMALATSVDARFLDVGAGMTIMMRLVYLNDMTLCIRHRLLLLVSTRMYMQFITLIGYPTI